MRPLLRRWRLPWGGWGCAFELAPRRLYASGTLQGKEDPSALLCWKNPVLREANDTQCQRTHWHRLPAVMYCLQVATWQPSWRGMKNMASSYRCSPFLALALTTILLGQCSQGELKVVSDGVLVTRVGHVFPIKRRWSDAPPPKHLVHALGVIYQGN